MPITLTVKEGPHEGRTFTFSQHDNFIVGRSVRAHFRLAEKDKYFSRFHFMVEVNPPLCRLLDLGSRNGTHVNGARVHSRELEHGDMIKAGRTVMEVAMEAELEDLPPDSVPEPVPTAPYPAPTPPSDPVFALETLMPQQMAAPTLSPPTLGGITGATVPSVPGGDEPAGPAPTVPGYRIVRLLGKGSMGVVYLAERTTDGAIVALKTVRPSMTGTPNQMARFLREANILKSLDHPHIVSFREMGEVGGMLYFAMDFVSGIDAKQFLKQHGPMPVPGAVRLICQALKGVAHAHECGFVHRDLKPSNLLITEAEGKRFVKVADFGLARVYQASQLSGLTLTGDLGGTPAFMPPEQVTNYREAKPAADQYSMAATLYNLLTDHYVFDASTPQEFFGLVLAKDPVPILSRRPDLPPALASMIHKALAKEPDERFPDVLAFRSALKPFGQ